MHRARWTTMLVAVAVGACRPAPSPPASEMDAESRASITVEVREAVEGLFEAMNAHDADRILEHYARRPDFAYIGALSPRFGWEQQDAAVRTWVVDDAAVTVTHETIHVQVLTPTSATAFSRGAYSAGPDAVVWTHVLVRGGDGRWRVVLEHEVWPGVSAPSGPHPM